MDGIQALGGKTGWKIILKGSELVPCCSLLHPMQTSPIDGMTPKETQSLFAEPSRQAPAIHGSLHLRQNLFAALLAKGVGVRNLEAHRGMMWVLGLHGNCTFESDQPPGHASGPLDWECGLVWCSPLYPQVKRCLKPWIVPSPPNAIFSYTVHIHSTAWIHWTEGQFMSRVRRRAGWCEISSQYLEWHTIENL